MAQINSFSYTLTPEQQQRMITVLKEGNYVPKKVPYTIMAVAADKCSVNLYKSGKLLIQGKGAQEFVLFVVEPMVLQSASLGYEAEAMDADPESSEPHCGIDESGKGDFFGPLVIAAVYVDPRIAEELRKAGVKDSKVIKSDRRIREIARAIRTAVKGQYAFVTIGSRAYNRLYMKIHNVNSILAWGHARAIENILDKVPGCPRALSDQFGPKQQIERALMKNGRSIVLDQRPKAESDIAVAAASILAREGFINALDKMKEQYGIEFPRGASAQVREAAEQLVRSKGAATLVDTAKCHFATTDKVLSACGEQRASLGELGQAQSKSAYAPKK
ncbi:MAG: ribonuclease HIII [Spartobacteria bacterium]|nr:ribonuclease HIII [Spartobacteria bacterium]